MECKMLRSGMTLGAKKHAKTISPKAPSQDLQRPWQADHAAGALPSDGTGFSYPESPNTDIVEKSMHFPTFTTQSQQRAAHAESRHEHPQDRSHEEGRQGRNHHASP